MKLVKAPARDLHSSGLCLVGNVKVLLDNKRPPIRIDQLKVGDRVLSVDPATAKIATSTIVRTFERNVKFTDLYGVNISCSPDQLPDDSDSIISTDEHLFATTLGWKKVKVLQIGERLKYFYKGECCPNSSSKSRFPRIIRDVKQYKFKCRMGREINKKFKDTDDITVFNIECSPNNNYFVGNSAVLVHDSSSLQKSTQYGSAKIVKTGTKKDAFPIQYIV